MSLHLATSTGQTITLGKTTLPALSGRHAGRLFKIEDVVKVNGQHMIKASRKHSIGRHTIHELPEIFGIVITEIEEVGREIVKFVKWLWLKIDEGLYMGTAALVPLAYFEHYEMADKIVHLFGMIF
jgi:hypothetical protein